VSKYGYIHLNDILQLCISGEIFSVNLYHTFRRRRFKFGQLVWINIVFCAFIARLNKRMMGILLNCIYRGRSLSVDCSRGQIVYPRLRDTGSYMMGFSEKVGVLAPSLGRLEIGRNIL
jgi:hypothetical protein